MSDPSNTDSQADLSAYSAEDETESSSAESGSPATPFPEADDDTTTVVAAPSESNSSIVSALQTREDVTVSIRSVAPADYVLSPTVAVTRFVFHKAPELSPAQLQAFLNRSRTFAEKYQQPVVLLEVPPGVATTDSLQRLRTQLLAEPLTLFEPGVTDETADLLHVIAQREQTDTSRSGSYHQGTQAQTLAEQQEYVIASLADLGPVTAGALLEHFSSVEAVVSASREELMTVPGIGEELATRIRELVSRTYPGAHATDS